MRLSDLIKNGPESDKEKPGRKKPAVPEKAPAKEDSFRLAGLGNLQKAEEAPAPVPETPVAKEEVPFAVPDLPQAPYSAPGPPAQEAAAPSPFADQPPAPIQKEAPKRPRRSVLAGPETPSGGNGERKEGHLPDPIENNPYAGLRERAIQFVFQFLQAVADDESFPLDEAEDIVYTCIEEPDAIENLYTLAVSTIDTSNSMAIHLFNHMVYSLKLGFGLKWPQDRIVRLGVAALIHDIGMCTIPQHIRHKEGKLTSEELAEIRNHPQYGMEIISHIYGEPFHWLAEAIYHEHERENGRGYPQGLSGNQISEYAKIIGLADVYEALTHHRPHRKRMLPHKAVQKIVQAQKVQFHQRLLKVMIEELSVFSLNSLVRLNSNAIGRESETISGQPLRPVVQLIFDADGNEIMEDRYIALKEFSLLYIGDEVEESELPTNQ